MALHFVYFVVTFNRVLVSYLHTRINFREAVIQVANFAFLVKKYLEFGEVHYIFFQKVMNTSKLYRKTKNCKCTITKVTGFLKVEHCRKISLPRISP